MSVQCSSVRVLRYFYVDEQLIAMCGPFPCIQGGDEILSINGLYIAESTHGEVVNILRSHKNLLLKVRSE